MSRRPPQTPPGRPPDRPGRNPVPAPPARGPARTIALCIAGVLVLAALSVLFVVGLGRSPAATIGPLGIGSARATPTLLPPEPALESSPGQTAAFVESRENPVLNSYGWVDQKSGVARIPVQQAMTIISQRGLPARPASTATAQDEGLTLPSYSSSGRYPEAVLH
jgi:hypothetical protein